MADQKPVDLSAKYASSEDLARLPRGEQQRRLGGNNPNPQASDGRRRPPAQEQRTLTPGERHERQMAFQRAASTQGPVPPFEQSQAQDDPNRPPHRVRQGVRQPDGGPHEGAERRMARVLAAPGPGAVDHDRDGHPDHGAGRSSRDRQNFHSAADGRARAAAHAPEPSRDTPRGQDGHRQDQIGYRDRLRARKEALAAAEGGQGDDGAQGDPLADFAAARRGADGNAVQTSNAGPYRPDGSGRPAQATLDEEGKAVAVSDPQGREVAAATPNEPIDGGQQLTLPEGQPHPVSPAPNGGPAGTPIAHGGTEAPPESSTSPSATSPAAAPEQQAVPGQQHPTAQQAPAQEPASKVAGETPSAPPENAPKPADTPDRNAKQDNQGKSDKKKN